jgi:hypothetical protein
MRHPNVRNADEVEAREMIKGRHNMRLRQLGKPAGSRALGATLTEVAPVRSPSPAMPIMPTRRRSTSSLVLARHGSAKHASRCVPGTGSPRGILPACVVRIRSVLLCIKRLPCIGGASAGGRSFAASHVAGTLTDRSPAFIGNHHDAVWSPDTDLFELSVLGAKRGSLRMGHRSCKTRSSNGSHPTGTDRCYGAGGEDVATSSLHLTDGVPRCPSRMT